MFLYDKLVMSITVTYRNGYFFTGTYVGRGIAV